MSTFAPTNLNISDWIASFQAVGVTSAVLTAKHGCGFLAWEPKTTLPDGSPYRYNVPASMPIAKMFAEATEAAGIGHGYYLSLTNNFYCNELDHVVQPPSTLLPGMANVTQAEYEDMVLSLITELWTDFGNLTEIWLDGGCGSACCRPRHRPASARSGSMSCPRTASPTP